MNKPNFLIIMVDEERYPPIYENKEIKEWRKKYLKAQEFLKKHGLEFHNHYTGSTACSPSRGTLYTGQYPSLHGVSQTTGIAKSDFDDDIFWLDPNTVPTIGDFLKVNGYNAFWKGKWHASQQDILIPDTHDSFLSYNQNTGAPLPEKISIYNKANKLSGYGFDNWIGPEPFGRAPRNSGASAPGPISGRDNFYAKEAVELIKMLDEFNSKEPWAIVVSFVNPHDITLYGEVTRALPEFDFRINTTVPNIPKSPTADENLDLKPTAQKSYREVYQKALQPTLDTEEYRRFYYSLQQQVDEDMQEVLNSLVESSFYEDTIIIFTADHGELLGSHGGLFQKWYQAYEESIHVPLIVHNPRLFKKRCNTDILTSHVDILPTILGLAGINEENTLSKLSKDHTEARQLVGKDLSNIILNKGGGVKSEPVYFMTDDNATKGLNQTTLTGESYTSVKSPNSIETIIVNLSTGKNGKNEKWKYSKYFDNTQFWTSPGESDKNLIKSVNEDSVYMDLYSVKTIPVEAEYEMYNITRDPLEICNLINYIEEDCNLKEIDKTLKALLFEQCKRKRIYPQSGEVEGKPECGCYIK